MQRPRNLIVRQQSRRDLVQHGAKGVIIPFINHRDADWSVAQRMRCGESSETTTDMITCGAMNCTPLTQTY